MSELILNTNQGKGKGRRGIERCIPLLVAQPPWAVSKVSTYSMGAVTGGGW